MFKKLVLKGFALLKSLVSTWGVLMVGVMALLAIGFIASLFGGEDVQIGYANLWYATIAITIVSMWLRMRDKLIGGKFNDTYNRIKTDPMASAIYHGIWVWSAAYVVRGAFLGS